MILHNFLLYNCRKDISFLISLILHNVLLWFPRFREEPRPSTDGLKNSGQVLMVWRTLDKYWWSEEPRTSTDGLKFQYTRPLWQKFYTQHSVLSSPSNSQQYSEQTPTSKQELEIWAHLNQWAIYLNVLKSGTRTHKSESVSDKSGLNT